MRYVVPALTIHAAVNPPTDILLSVVSPFTTHDILFYFSNTF